MSARERNLAAAVGGILLVAAAFLVVRGALARLDELDRRIERMEQTIVNYQAQIAVGETVDRAFSRIASQHSSRWTEPEIHDRLYREIYRLAMKVPPPPHETGVGAGARRDETLVYIPGLRQGTLRERDGGYREYRIDVRPNTSDLRSALVFIQRLLESPQALRIDSIDIRRPFQVKELVTLQLVVTRTIVDGVAGADFIDPMDVMPWGLLTNPSFEAEPEDDGTVPGWQALNCEVNAAPGLVTDGYRALLVENASGNPAVFQEVALDPAKKYQLEVDVMATGPARLSVMNADTNEVFRGPAAEIVADGTYRRYTLRFMTPEGDGPVSVRVPYVVPKPGEGALRLDLATLKRI